MSTKADSSEILAASDVSIKNSTEESAMITLIDDTFTALLKNGYSGLSEDPHQSMTELKLNGDIIGCSRFVTKSNPVLLLGQCLPIDFKRDVIDGVLFERSPEQRQKWYDDHKLTITGPMMWGSLIGSVYRQLQSILVMCEACVLPAFTERSGALANFPKEIHNLVSEYFVGPIPVLSKLVDTLGKDALKMFPGGCQSEDSILFRTFDHHRYLLKRFHFLLQRQPSFASLALQDQEIHLLMDYFQQQSHPYDSKVVSNLSTIYWTIKRVCTIGTFFFTTAVDFSSIVL